MELPPGIGHVCSRCMTRLNGRHIKFFENEFDSSCLDNVLTTNFSSLSSLFPDGAGDDELLKKELSCILCLGLLFGDHPKSILPQIVAKTMIDGGYECLSPELITGEVVMPPNVVFRQYVFFAHADFPSGCIDIKDAVRAMFNAVVAAVLQSGRVPRYNLALPALDNDLPLCPPNMASVRPFSVRVVFEHPDNAEEVEGFRQFNRATWVKTQQGQRKRRKTQPPAVSTATIQESLQHLSKLEMLAMVRGSPSGRSTFETVLSVPQSGAVVTIESCEIYREYTHLMGRYVKRSRQVSQCPWKKRPQDVHLSDDPLKQTENEDEEDDEQAEEQAEEQPPRVETITLQGVAGQFNPKACTVFLQDAEVTSSTLGWKWSVEGVLDHVFQRHTKCEDTNMVASGREDVDVRMMGNGRDFVVVLKNCRRASHDPAWVQMIQDEINVAAEGRVEINSLRWAPASAVKHIHTSAESHSKVYRCVVWLKDAHSKEELERKLTLSKLQIQQNTPIRVLHRRSALVRPRMVHWMEPKWINPHFCVLTLETQAGTYIKEFVHGDLGRTTPSVRQMIGCDADILQLDVQNLIG